MFTGLVEEVGIVESLSRERGGVVLQVSAQVVVSAMEVGDSVAVDGACLTAERVRPDGFTVFLSSETLSRTTLSSVGPGRRVNLERALKLGDRLGGHIVQGHVDATGVVAAVRSAGEGKTISLRAPESVSRYLVEKCSIAVDGVSLTVAALRGGEFDVAVVPHTLSRTTLAEYAPGREVNLEVDLLAKYVERLLGAGKAGGVDMDLLAREGFLR